MNIEQINNEVLNHLQTIIADLHLEEQPDEVQEQFLDFFYNVPYIQRLVSKDRPRACDLPRDEEGKIIIDITHPHILEDMDYFRPSAIHYQKHGCYTKLRPNKNPNSEFSKWLHEEVRRCRYGYVRESDGEWVTGDFYYFLNYFPMAVIKKRNKNSRESQRVIDFPSVWEGHYYKFHLILQARQQGKHYAELASRSKGKSATAASMLGKRFIMGEADDVNQKVTCYITADDRKYLVGGDQTLDKFQYGIDFFANNMELPYLRITNSLSNMQWMMGYKDVDTGTIKGTQNAVIGVTSHDDPSKLRGSRGVLYILEEFGSFAALLTLYNNLRPSVEYGEDVFGLIMAQGTAGDSQSDFAGAQELIYNPDGYNIISVDNIYDKEGYGRRKFSYFFPAYMNLAGCYDENGNSDVTKALLQILIDRYNTRHNTQDINSITKRIAELPIVPQEAVMRTKPNRFPVTQLTERLNQLDQNPNIFDDVYCGDLVIENGQVKFVPTDIQPIREFPLKGNRYEGAIEIFQMPEKQPDGNPYVNRYIASLDPVQNDEADTVSLNSCFVLDLFTDKIVAEYTGRSTYTDFDFEKVRLLCMFYNAMCIYEQNKKGPYAYFQRMHSLHLLADTPQYLKDKQLIKISGSYGNTSKGVNATVPIQNYGLDLLKDWLLKLVPATKEIDGIQTEYEINNLYFIKNRALLKELIMYNPERNCDRISSLIMLMVYREQFMILYEGNLNRKDNYDEYDASDPANDEFFTKNYHPKNAYATKQWYQN